MDWERLGRTILDILILTANGLLAVVWWLGEHWALAGILAIAAGVALFLDRPSGRQVAGRARRYGRGTVGRAPVTIYAGTALLAVAWTAIAAIVPAPIPQIGLLMWACLLLVPLMVPIEREPLRDRLRWLLWTYTAFVGGFMLLLRAQLNAATVLAWSRQAGIVGGGEAMLGGVVSSLTPYAALILWGLFPMTFFGYVATRLGMHRSTVVSPWRTVEQRIGDLRNRGER